MDAGFTIADIQRAQRRIEPYVRWTEIVKSETLSRQLNTNVYLKLEVFQKTGSFKVRGAFNKLLTLPEGDAGRGVAAWSGGNHGQAVAYAAATLGRKALIVMPENTPRTYRDAARDYGAQIELAADTHEASVRMDELAGEGWIPIHPFNDPLVIAGQGTVGLEIMADVPQVTDVIASIGGGGLIGGISTALAAMKPGVRFWGVETEGADCMAQSLAAGAIVTMPTITSIARTLGAPAPSPRTYALAYHYLESVTVVSDAEAIASLKFLLERAKILTEPAAAVTLSAARRLQHNFTPDHHVVLVLCGGNVALEDLCLWHSTFPASL